METKEEQELRVGFTLLLVGLLAVAAPLMLIFVRGMSGGFELLEELVKLLILLYMWRELAGQVKWYYGAGVGALFGVTELMLYVMNAVMVGVYEGLALRVVTTIPMHAVTPLLMLTIGQRFGKFGWGLGYLLAVGLHLVFNFVVS